MGRKSKGKVRVYVDSEKKQNRTPYKVGPDAYVGLNANAIRGLLNMGISTEAYKFILANIESKPNDPLARFRVGAHSKAKSALMNRNDNIKNATPTELKMKMLLSELGVAYEFQKIYFVGFSYYIVDFYLPEYNMVIEIDGQQHYEYNASIYDRLRTDNLTYLHGISRVIRFDNKDLAIDTDVKNRLLKELKMKEDKTYEEKVLL